MQKYNKITKYIGKPQQLYKNPFFLSFWYFLLLWQIYFTKEPSPDFDLYLKLVSLAFAKPVILNLVNFTYNYILSIAEILCLNLRPLGDSLTFS